MSDLKALPLKVSSQCSPVNPGRQTHMPCEDKDPLLLQEIPAGAWGTCSGLESMRFLTKTQWKIIGRCAK